MTDQLILTFNQKHALYIQYEEKTINNNFNLTSSENTADVNVSNILGILQNQIKSSALLSNAFMLTNTIIPGREVQYFDYEVGFDNIRVGFAEYADASIFASDSFRVNDLHQIALKSLELRPVEISGVVSFIKDTYLDPGVNNFFHGSIEYYSVIKNFDSLDNLIDINTVPILPIGSENIFFERLVLSNKLNSDIFNTGKLLFFTYFTPDNPNIFVYRNGTLLEYIKDWIIADYPITNTILPPTGIPNSIGIKILNPNVYDIFTVSYTPVTTTTRADPTTLGNLAVNEDINTVNIIDLVGDASIRMGENNILFLNSKKNNGNTVAYSIIALVIVLRRNSENIDLSPSVSEYTFLTTSANPDKIESGFNAK